MQTLFTSDLHLGHKNITKYRKLATSMDDHDEKLCTMLESFNKRTNLVVLGDFLFDGPNYEQYLKRLSSLPYKIKLVLGNHDSTKIYKDTPSNIEIQLPLFTYKNIWVSHCPIHPQEMRNRIGNIHGHLHGNIVDTREWVYKLNEFYIPKYFNVNLDNNDFKPVPLDTILSYFEGK